MFETTIIRSKMEKLDLTDRKILSELDKNCRISSSDLGKKVNKSREAVKYRIQQLQKNAVIKKFVTSINPGKLGYYIFKVYLKLENIPDEREKFFEELRNRKDIYWFGISDGAFDAVFIILSKKITEHYEKINAILSKWKHLVISKVSGMTIDTRQYNKKFFLSDTDGEFVVFGGNVIDNKVDEVDLNILNILSNDARIPMTELAKKVGSTIETVRNRIKKLEKKGIILNYRIEVDFNTLGLEFYKAIIYCRNLSEKDEKTLVEWLRVNPNCIYYIRSLAQWDIELEFVVENYQQFNEILNKLRKDFPAVIRNHEHLIMIYENWLPAGVLQSP